jgi:hypothetical protein
VSRLTRVSTRAARLLPLLALSAFAITVEPAAASAGLRHGHALPTDWGLFGPKPELDELSWLASGIHQSRPFRLAPDRSLSLLARYLAPAQNHVPDWRSFFRGDYGFSSWSPQPALTWSLASAAPEPESLSVSTHPGCPRWKAPRPVTVARYDGSEHTTLPLIDCDGGIAPDAIDVVSVLARAPGVERPELPLPLEPAADAGPGEWLPNLKLLEPRLIWALEQLAEAFPRRTLYLMSGYRQDGHSNHAKGRALDLFVVGVPNEQTFGVCRRLRDVGCGFYPNNKFVHIDVRPYGTDRVLWVDDSAPGAPSHYIDGYPGVLDPGRAWIPG